MQIHDKEKPEIFAIIDIWYNCEKKLTLNGSVKVGSLHDQFKWPFNSAHWFLISTVFFGACKLNSLFKFKKEL